MGGKKTEPTPTRVSKLQFNSIWNSFDRLINTLCVFLCLFAASLVRCVCFAFDIYHVNIQLHQSTHCRISMFQTWSLCYGHAHFQVNVNRRWGKGAVKNETDVIFDPSLFNVDDKKVFFFIKKFNFVGVSL